MKTNFLNPVLCRLIALPLLSLAGCKTYFHDDFNSDAVGVPPALMPAGYPGGDRLSISGTPDAHKVLLSVPFASRIYQMGRGSRQPRTQAECILASGPRRSGRYMITFRARSIQSAAPLTISAKADTGEQIFELQHQTNNYIFNGLTAVRGTFDSVHKLRILVDMDRQLLSFLIDDRLVYSNEPFLTSAPNFASVSFDYAPAILEALPGVYQVDDILVKKRWFRCPLR